MSDIFVQDGVSLGVVFKDLDKVEESLYPAFSSTAAKTCMSVAFRKRSFSSLQVRM